VSGIDEATAVTAEVEALAGRLAKRAGAGVTERMDAAYTRCATLERMFWDARSIGWRDSPSDHA
jgi:thiaminase